MPWARVAADAVVVVHAAYVAFVVLGMAAILAGVALRWEWVRGVRFRVAHLAAIVVVVLEAAGGVACPLTSWENALRRRAGQGAYAGDFLGYWAHRLVYFRAGPRVVTLLQVAFGAAVLLAFLLAPPRRAPRPLPRDRVASP